MTPATCQYLLGLAIAARDRAAAAMIAADAETSVEYGQAALAVRELIDASIDEALQTHVTKGCTR